MRKEELLEDSELNDKIVDFLKNLEFLFLKCEDEDFKLVTEVRLRTRNTSFLKATGIGDGVHLRLTELFQKEWDPEFQFFE